jgi:hypothetical protein
VEEERRKEGRTEEEDTHRQTHVCRRIFTALQRDAPERSQHDLEVRSLNRAT